MQQQQEWLERLVTHKEWLDQAALDQAALDQAALDQITADTSDTSASLPSALQKIRLGIGLSKLGRKASTRSQKRPPVDAHTTGCEDAALAPTSDWPRKPLPPHSDWLTSLEWLMMEHTDSGMSYHDFFSSQKKACERLQILCAPAGSEQDASDAGVVEAAVASMWAHPQVVGVQQQGCVLLNYVCCGTDVEEDPTRLVARSQRATEAGGLEAVVAAMQAHSQVAAVQEEGFTALCNMCYGHDAAGLARSQRAVDAGALEVVVAAMWAHLHLADLQVVGCGLLHNVCYGTDAAGLARLQSAADAGALEVVLAAMRAHPDMAEVQVEGCMALINVCHDTDAPKRAVKAGVFEAVVAMMQVHLQVADVQRLGCMLLCRVCGPVANPAARARMRLATEAGGRRVAVAAIQAHPGHEEVQRRGKRVLNCLPVSDLEETAL